MKKILCVILLFLSIPPAFGKNENPDALGMSVGVDYISDYLWRGMYIFNHDAAVFPFANIKLAELTLSYIGEYSEDYVTMKDNSPETRLSDKKHTADFGIDFSHTFKNAITLGAGAWYFHFLNIAKKDFTTGTVFVTLDGIPFRPTFKYSHDYYIETKKKMNFYVQFGLSRDIEIRDAAFSFGVIAGYYNADTLNKRGLSDITATLGVKTTISNVTLSGSLNYVFVPSHDYYRIRQSSGKVVTDKQKTFATFGATLSI